MPISKHPDIATLMTCSAGSTPEALCAVVTSHLSMCPECQAELGAMENIGVALFEQTDPVAMSGDMPLAIPASVADDGDGHTRPVGDVPGPLVNVIGHNLDDLDWEFVESGISSVRVPMTARAKGDLRLVKLAPDAHLREGRHPGEELILVLRGSCHDEDAGNCPVGDFVERDGDVKPALTGGADGCVILVGNEHVPEFVAALA